MEVLTQESDVVIVHTDESQMLLNFGQVSSVTLAKEQEAEITTIKTDESSIYRS